jgi:hypothetical protein
VKKYNWWVTATDLEQLVQVGNEMGVLNVKTDMSKLQQKNVCIYCTCTEQQLEELKSVIPDLIYGYDLFYGPPEFNCAKEERSTK